MKVKVQVLSTLVAFCFSIAFLWCSSAKAQTGTSDAAALTLARQFLTLASGNSAVSSFQATGSATIYNGTNREPAIVHFASAGPHYTFAQFQSASSTYIEQGVLDASGNVIGQFVNGNQSPTPIACRNLYVASSWFFPLFSNLAQTSDASLRFFYLGSESWHEIQVLHVRVTKYVVTGIPRTPADSFDTEYYINPQTYLLSGMSAALSPDDGSPAKVSWEIRYGNYVTQQGVMVPMHIEQYLNGTLLRQVDLSSVQLNSSVPQSMFSF